MVNQESSSGVTHYEGTGEYPDFLRGWRNQDCCGFLIMSQDTIKGFSLLGVITRLFTTANDSEENFEP